MDVHHIIPRNEGGPDTEENAVPLCPSCHRKFGNNPDLRVQIREKRDIWYEICEAREVQNDLVRGFEDLKQAIDHLRDAGEAERLRAELHSLKRKLCDLQETSSQIQSKLRQALQREIQWHLQVLQWQMQEARWECWPGMSDDPTADEAQQLLYEATGNTFQAVMDWRERFVYYLLLKSGGRVDSYDFCELAFKKFVKTFPSPNPAWQTQVLGALGELRLKGFIEAPTNFTPGTEIVVVEPFPYSWQEFTTLSGPTDNCDD